MPSGRRAGKTAHMRQPSERIFNLPPVIVWLGATLLIVHLARWAAGPHLDEWILLSLAFIPARYAEAADATPGGAGAWLWTPLTYAFLHGGTLHLVVNIVWMASFGSAVARRFGTLRFLALSGISAVAGAALFFVVRPYEMAIVIGASAAVSGMTAAAARFVFAPGGALMPGPVRSGNYWNPAPPLSRIAKEGRALTFILIWFGINLLFGMQPMLVPGVEGSIAWEAHIGGFLAGLLLFSLLDPVPGMNDRLATRSEAD